MKKNNYLILSLLFLLLSFSNSNGQNSLPEFAPVGAKWTYPVYAWAPSQMYHSNHIVSLAVDTIAGKPCKDLGYFYAYRDSMQMYVYRKNKDTSWQLLWDFSLQVGDSFKLLSNYSLSGLGRQVKITYKSDTVINGFTLPLFRYSDGYYTTNTVVMNIGSLEDDFLPWPGDVTDIFIYPLRCYEDTVIGMVKDPNVVNCDTVYPGVGVREIAKQEQGVQLYPNPARNQVRIENLNAVSMFQLNDISGRIIKTETISPAHNTVDVNGFAPGIYFFTITTNDRLTTKGKLIKE